MENVFSGVALPAPVEGERVKVALRCIGPEPGLLSSSLSRDAVAHISRLNNSMAQVKDISPMGATKAPVTCSFPHVFGDDDSSTAVASVLRPLAVGAACGTDASIVAATGSLTSNVHRLFDHEARKSLALNLIEMVVAECQKRNSQCFLSLGAADTVQSRLAVDILATTTRPVMVELQPELQTGCLFPTMNLVNITGSRRLAETLFNGLTTLAKLQEQMHLTKAADLFAIVTVVSHLSTGVEVTSRLNIVDLGSTKRLEELTLRHAEPADPVVGGRIAPLLAYGVMRANRCTIIGTTPTTAKPADMQLCETLAELQRGFVYPQNRLRTVSLLHGENDEEGVRTHWLWALRELGRLRAQVNDTAASDTFDTVEGLKQQLSTTLSDLRTTSELLVKRLPSPGFDEGSDSSTRLLWNSHAAVIRQVENEQADRMRWLDQYHEWLTSLPVVKVPPIDTAMEHATRMDMLERSCMLQRDENRRLQKLFKRDVALLQNQLDAAQTTARGSSKISSPFEPMINQFLEEFELVMKDASSEGTARAVPRTLHLIEELTTTMKRDALLFLDPQSPQNVEPTVSFCRSVFGAAVDKLRRRLGIPIDPPSAQADAPSHEYWEELVFERTACRMERSKLRNAAESLALHVSRVAAALTTFMGEIDTFLERANQLDGGFNQGGGLKVRNVVTGANASAIERMLVAEMGDIGAKTAATHRSRVNTTSLQYSLEKCAAMVEVLRDVANGTVTRLQGEEEPMEYPLHFDSHSDMHPMAPSAMTGGSDIGSGESLSETLRQSNILKESVDARDGETAAMVEVKLDAVVKKEKAKASMQASQSIARRAERKVTPIRTSQRGFFSDVESKKKLVQKPTTPRRVAIGAPIDITLL